jgi:hypothetical protein
VREALLSEWYDPDADPRDALARQARRLNGMGALYLGGGVGVEKQGKTDAPQFVVTADGKKASSHPGPLSAATAAYKSAGGSKAPDSPGGSATIADPAIAARVHELEGAERDAKRDISRFEARMAARARRTGLPGYVGDDDRDWEARRLEELRATVKSIAAEKARLIAGKVSEEVGPVREPGLIGELLEREPGKPGTNWKQVTPENRKRVNPLVQHYMKMAHPFTVCVADNTKRFGPERAKKVCAVVKDMGRRTTKWRKGGGKVTEADIALAVGEAVVRVTALEQELGKGAAAKLALEEAQADTFMESLCEMALGDMSLLYLTGHELGESLIEEHERREYRHRDGKFANVTQRVRSSGEESPLKSADGSLRLHTEPTAQPEPVAESLMDSILAAEDARA